jgi:ribosome-associated protein
VEELQVNRRFSISPRSLRVETSTASGPGGQRLNRVQTRVTLIYDLGRCEVVGEARRRRIEDRLGRRVAGDGTVRVTCGRHRQQSRNLQEARERLAGLLADALTPQKARRPTRPTTASKVRRRTQKARRGARKAERGRQWGGDD